jgi:hypothetical protein
MIIMIVRSRERERERLVEVSVHGLRFFWLSNQPCRPSASSNSLLLYFPSKGHRNSEIVEHNTVAVNDSRAHLTS